MSEIPHQSLIAQMALEASSTTQVRLRLSTREQDLQLENPAPILVPTSFRRYALSTLVNGLLSNDRPVPLEFIVNGSYLRTTLEEYLNSQGISSETTLSVEYVRARLPPQYVASFEHDDWVSAVDVLSSSSSASKQTSILTATEQPLVLSASYDGHLRLWNSSSQVIGISPTASNGGHASFIKSAKFINPSQVVSASFDRSIRLWKISQNGDTDFSISPQLELYGHKGSVDSIAAHSPSGRLLSASVDNAVGLWSSKKSDAPSVEEEVLPREAKKRRRTEASSFAARRGPLALMSRHTGPVSSVAFDSNDHTVGYSTSWDQTMRTWDLVTSTLVDTRTTSHALLSLQQMPSLQLIATGSAGRDVKLVDPRAAASIVTAMTLRGHKNSVVALASDPGNDYTLLSGSHDGTCRIWDLRSTRQERDGMTGQSVFTIPRESSKGTQPPLAGEGIKVFDVCWDGVLGILSAGEDKTVQVNQTSSNT